MVVQRGTAGALRVQGGFYPDLSFQDPYAQGRLCPPVFAIISLSSGLASLLNTRLVMHFGMRSWVWRALWHH